MIVVVARDLLITSRIEEVAAREGMTALRIDDPAALPEPDDVHIALVDWTERKPDWPNALVAWRQRARGPRQPRVMLFGPHTDLSAHAAARAAGLGPMRARSALLRDLPGLIGH